MFLILSYVTGIAIIIVALFNHFFPSRSKSLIIKAILDGITILNLLFVYFETGSVNLIAGIVATGIGLTRDFVYLFRNKNKFFNHKIWPLVFCLIFAGSLIFTYKTPLSILPCVGSLFSTGTLFSNSQKKMKIGAIVCLSLYIVYYVILLPESDILTLFSLISALTGFIGAWIGLIHFIIKDKKNKNDIKINQKQL